MAFDLPDLLACLHLRSVGDGVMEGSNLDIGYHRVFGGQILAQVIMAAAAASPGKSVKSITVLFPREGDTGQPMRYRVIKTHDGRTFGTMEITAHQGDKVIAVALVSMHIAEDGPYHSHAPPEVGGPADAVAYPLPMIPWEVRSVGGVDLASGAVGPASLELWMRAADGPAEGAIHQALLAHATDLTLIGTALRPFEGLSQASSTVSLHTAVTSHSLWFHQPFRLDDWVLIAQHSPLVAHGRAFGRGDVFGAAGELVASFAQEAMVRPMVGPS